MARKRSIDTPPADGFYGCPEDGCEINYAHTHQDYPEDINFAENAEDDSFCVSYQGVLYRPENIKTDTDGNIISLDLIDSKGDIIHLYVDENGEMCEAIELAEKKWSKRKKTIYAVGAAAVSTVILASWFAGFQTDTSSASPNSNSIVAVDTVVSPTPLPTASPEASVAPTPVPEASVAAPTPSEVAPPPPPPPAEVADYAGVGYNVKYGNESSVKDIIRWLNQGASWVTVQEFTDLNLQEAVKTEAPLCPEPECEYDGQVGVGDDGATSIFWNNDRFDRVDDELTGVFTLYEAQKVKNGDGTTSKLAKKTMTVVRLRDALKVAAGHAQPDAYVMSLHLPFRVNAGVGPDKDEIDRLNLLTQAMGIIKAKIAELKNLGIPIFIEGDVNWAYYPPPIEHPMSPSAIIRSMGCQNAFDPGVVDNSPEVQHTHTKDGKKYRKIDHWYYCSPDGKKIISRQIFTGGDSDHQPIWMAAKS